MPAAGSREQLIYILAKDEALTLSAACGEDIRWGETEEEFRRLSTWHLRELIEEKFLNARRRGRPAKRTSPISQETAEIVWHIVRLRQRNAKLTIAGACSKAEGFRGLSKNPLRKRFYDGCRRMGRDPHAR